jgi:hypothetical protein
MSEAFAFVNQGRTFTCTVERRPSSGTDAWWWFHVSTDDHHRYAPFRAEPTDTVDSVQSRVIQYYEEMLARRAAPAVSPWQRRRDARDAANAARQQQPPPAVAVAAPPS